MNDIQVFDFEDNAVRVIDKDGDPWFVAADVARVLEYSSAKDACRILDDDEKGGHNVPTPGGEQEMNVINESGLYHLVLVSRKPEAKKFRKWVTAEVLPSIRKTGMYIEPEMDCRAPAGARNFENSGENADGSLPDRTFTQWINLIRETRLLFGRAAARDVWARSPLPAPSGMFIENKDVQSVVYDENAGQDALRLILASDTPDGVLRDLIAKRREKAMRRAGVRFFYKDGVEYLSVACVCFRRVVAGTIFDNGGLSRALLCLPGAFIQKTSVRFGRSVCRPVVVPISLACEQAA